MKREFGKRSDHLVEKLKEGVYCIDEFGSSNCFLIVGNARALLIDTGTGYGDLRSVTEKITDLPLTVAVTRAHQPYRRKRAV